MAGHTKAGYISQIFRKTDIKYDILEKNSLIQMGGISSDGC